MGQNRRLVPTFAINRESVRQKVGTFRNRLMVNSGGGSGRFFAVLSGIGAVKSGSQSYLLQPTVFPLTPHPGPLPEERENPTQRFRIPMRFPVGDQLASVLPLLGERVGVRGQELGKRPEDGVLPLAFGFRTSGLVAGCSTQNSEEPM